MDNHLSAQDEKNDRIWERVMHTDGRVTAMESQMAAVVTSVNRIETLLLDNKGPSPIAWFGVIFSVLTLGGGLVFGMNNQFEQRIQPLESIVGNQQEHIEMFAAFQKQTHYELGMIHEWKTKSEMVRVEIMGELDDIEIRLRESEKGVATLKPKVDTNATYIDKFSKHTDCSLHNGCP